MKNYSPGNYTQIQDPKALGKFVTQELAKISDSINLANQDITADEAASAAMQSAWTAYTPTVTAGSGTFTTVSATGRYKQIGKTVFVSIRVLNTTNGTAASFVVVTLPFAPVIPNIYALSGFYQNGSLVAGNAGSAFGGSVNIFKYDGTFPMVGVGDVLWVSGVYESV